MKKVLETERLFFRELLPSDAEALFELDSDPAVVLYTGDAPLTHVDQARQRIEGIRQQYRDYGVGRWAAILKETNAFIGWAGLKYIQVLNGRTDNYDLGYRFLKSHWGKGYATESAQAFVRYAFDNLKLARISATADVRHVDSVKVLEKCGLQCTNTFMDEGDLCGWYEVVNASVPAK